MSAADGVILGTTKFLDNGDDMWRLNLVFVAEGYQAGELPQFATDAQNALNGLLAVPPWDVLRCNVNAYRIDVASTDSGAADPPACGGSVATLRTFFDASLCGNGQDRRSIRLDLDSVRIVVGTRVANATVGIVLVNAAFRGGTGWPGVLAITNGNPLLGDVLAHELGHSLFKLGDEYDYGGACNTDATAGRNLTHSADEPAWRNLTVAATEGDRFSMKWADLVNSTTPLPTQSNPDCTKCDPNPSAFPASTVGAFEGADTFKCGAYRAQTACEMRTLGDAFCDVCYRAVSEGLSAYGIRTVEGAFGDSTSGAGVAVADIDGDGGLELAPLGGWKVHGRVMFSGRDSGLFDAVVERVLELAPGPAEGCGAGDRVGEAGVELGERGVDDPRVGLGEQDGDHPAVVGELVALGAWDAVDEALPAQAAQVVGGLARGVAGDQAGDELAQAAVRQPVEEVAPVAQAGQQRHHAWVAEPEAGGG